MEPAQGIAPCATRLPIEVSAVSEWLANGTPCRCRPDLSSLEDWLLSCWDNGALNWRRVLVLPQPKRALQARTFMLGQPAVEPLTGLAPVISGLRNRRTAVCASEAKWWEWLVLPQRHRVCRTRALLLSYTPEMVSQVRISLTASTFAEWRSGKLSYWDVKRWARICAGCLAVDLHPSPGYWPGASSDMLPPSFWRGITLNIRPIKVVLAAGIPPAAFGFGNRRSDN